MKAPCPFCGSYESHPQEVLLGMIAIVCGGCGASGPPRESEAKAIDFWGKDHTDIRTDSVFSHYPPLVYTEQENATIAVTDYNGDLIGELWLYYADGWNFKAEGNALPLLTLREIAAKIAQLNIAP